MLSFWINYVCTIFKAAPGRLTKFIGKYRKSERKRNMADPAGSAMSSGTRSVYWPLSLQRISEMVGETR